MQLIKFLSLLPRPILRLLMPHVRLADLRYSIESIIVEAWLNEPSERRRILVIGGDPLLHLPLAQQGAQLVGLATSTETVQAAHRLAQKMGIPHLVQFYVSDLLRLPFPAAHFDAVLCGSELARSSDDLFILREMTRVLKNGGILCLTLPSFEAAGVVAKFVPRHWLIDELHQPEAVSSTGTPVPAPRSTLAEMVQHLLQQRQQLRRLYSFAKLGTRLDLLGLEIADHGPYLTRLGGMVYEAFHVLRALDKRKTFGRWLYALLSPLLLAPTLIVDANSQEKRGFGVRIAAVKRSDQGNQPRWGDEGGGLQMEWDAPIRERQSDRSRVPALPF